MTPVIPRDLGGGLLLRQATAADAEALVGCNGTATGNWETGEPDEGSAIWTRDLLEGRHPNVSPGEFTVIEDMSTRTIVPSICLISDTWTYGGIPFGVGEAQLVGTRPAYRRRGLVRAQFEVIHRWSAERGQPVQIVSGIPWYYRQFGCERFPEWTFLQLLFGHRSLEELEYAFADCGAATNEVRVLLNILFPKQPSAVYTVG